MAPGELAATLREIELFASFDDEALEALAATMTRVTVPGGEVLLREGDAADCAFVVRSGRLRVTVAEPDGSDRMVGERGRGDLVGEMALLTNEPRSATVTVVRDSELVRLPGDALMALFAHPHALRTVTTQLVARVREAQSGATPRSPVATVAVVPLSRGEAVEGTVAALGAALAERAPGVSLVTERDARAAIGRPGAAGSDAGADDGGVDEALTRWTSTWESEHLLVLYVADPEPTSWSRQCIRQADVVLLVADARSRPARRAVEDLLDLRRQKVPVRCELLLVHPPDTTDPRRTAHWLDPRTIDAHHHARSENDADLARVARHLLDRPIVLVLSGGGARGMAHIGVVGAMQELGVPIDAVAGTSVGALVGGAVARGWTYEHLVDDFRSGLVGSSPLDPTFPALSLATGRRVTEKLRTQAAGLDLEDTWLPFFCVSTNLSRNTAFVHHRGEVWRAVRASFAIPGVFPPMRWGDDVLVDGGLIDNHPVGRMRAEHEGGTVIGVDVGARRDLPAGQLPDSGMVSGWSVLWPMLNPLRRRPETVNIVRVLARLSELGKEPGADEGDVVIRPDVADVSILDFERLDETVERGHRTARAVLEPWLEARGGAPF